VDPRRRQRRSPPAHRGPAQPIPATYWAAAADAAFTPVEERTEEQLAAVALAAQLVDELAAADALLFAVPLYNFGVAQHFKTYVDRSSSLKRTSRWSA
jgi:FMN-dependent NADH-azoreductase